MYLVIQFAARTPHGLCAVPAYLTALPAAANTRLPPPCCTPTFTTTYQPYYYNLPAVRVPQHLTRRIPITYTPATFYLCLPLLLTRRLRAYLVLHTIPTATPCDACSTVPQNTVPALRLPTRTHNTPARCAHAACLSPRIAVPHTRCPLFHHARAHANTIRARCRAFAARPPFPHCRCAIDHPQPHTPTQLLRLFCPGLTFTVGTDAQTRTLFVRIDARAYAFYACLLPHATLALPRGCYRLLYARTTLHTTTLPRQHAVLRRPPTRTCRAPLYTCCCPVPGVTTLPAGRRSDLLVDIGAAAHARFATRPTHTFVRADTLPA